MLNFFKIFSCRFIRHAGLMKSVIGPFILLVNSPKIIFKNYQELDLGRMQKELHFSFYLL